MSIDTGSLDAYLTLLESADEQIDREAAAALRQTQDALSDYAVAIAHRKSGNMAETIHALGPFALGGGVLESQISSAAPYTIFELAQGEEHDWASRTLAEQAALLDALAATTGRIVATALGAE